MRWRWLALGLVIALAIGLRFFRLGSVPVGLYWDEIAMLVDARSVAATGFDMHHRPWYQVMYPSYGDYKLPVYIWLASAAVKLFGVSAWSLRLPSALAGVVTVIVAGALAVQLHQRSTSKSSNQDLIRMLTMVVVATAPWSIMFSRTGFEGHLGQCWLALSIWCLLLSRRRFSWWWVSPVLGAVATYTYFSVRFVWPVVSVASMLVLAWSALSTGERRTLKAWWPWLIKIGLNVALFGLLLVPMIRSPLYADSTRFRLGTTSVLNSHDYAVESNQYRELAGNTPLDRLVFHRKWLLLRELLQNYADHLNPTYLFLVGDANLRHGTGEHGLFPLVELPLLLIGLVWWWRRQPAWLSVLLLWWLIALLPASVPEDTPHALRSLNALVPISLVISGGAIWVVTTAQTWLVQRKWRTNVVPWLVSFSLVLSIWPWWYHYHTFYKEASLEAWQGNYAQVASAIFQLRDHHQPVAIANFDYRFYLWLLAFGPYQPSEYQTWPTKQYLFQSFDGIDTDSHAVPATEAVVAGRRAKIEEWLTPANSTAPHYQVVRQVTVPGPSDETSYVVAVVKLDSR